MKKSILLLAMTTMLTACGSNSNNTTNAKDSEEPTVSENEESSTIDVSELECGVYSNPVQVFTSAGSDFKTEVADPTVVRDPDTGTFYSFSTDRVLLSSDDGCIWSVYAQGDNVINMPTWGEEVQPGKSVNLWAPDVVKLGDTWYYFYSLSGWGSPCGIGYGTSDNIAGPYVDQGRLFSCDDIGIYNCIDPQVVVDDVTGDIWCVVGSFQGEYMVQLNQEDDGTISVYGGMDYQNDNKILIAGTPSASWDGSQYEGSYIIKKGEYYYYFGSSGSCCEGQSSSYQVRVGRSKSITGPYVDSKGIALTQSHGGTTYGEIVVWAGVNNKNIAGPGHNSIVIDDAGDYWLYYHSYSNLDSFGTRHLFMDKLVWNDNGYPSVEGKKPSFQEEKDGPRIK